MIIQRYVLLYSYIFYIYYRSNKNGCPVKLHVTANLHKKVLVVSKWISDHNHLPVSSTGTNFVKHNTYV